MTKFAGPRFTAPGPKRILSIDGGGVRGIVSIAFLERIEKTLQGQLGRGDDFVLSDYFDLIGGTSVGSIIATQLAMGARVSVVRNRFVEWAPHIFQKGNNPIVHNGIVRAMFPARQLTAKLKSVFGDETLASDRLRTGLCIVMKRINTGSVWSLTNNPFARYWEPRPIPGTNRMRRGNKEYKLWELIRASTAAPTYFTQKRIEIFEGPTDGEKPGWFIDGAVSPYNNPALMMFMMAGMKGFNFGGGDVKANKGEAWKLGDEHILMTSVGTGSYAVEFSPGMSAAWDAKKALEGMIADGADLGLTLLQWMSKSRHPWFIDREMRNLKDDLLHAHGQPAVPLLAFQRYDIKLETDDLNADRKSIAAPSEFASLQKLIEHGNVKRLYDIASVAAVNQVSAEDFPPAFRPAVV